VPPPKEGTDEDKLDDPPEPKKTTAIPPPPPAQALEREVHDVDGDKLQASSSQPPLRQDQDCTKQGHGGKTMLDGVAKCKECLEAIIKRGMDRSETTDNETNETVKSIESDQAKNRKSRNKYLGGLAMFDGLLLGGAAAAVQYVQPANAWVNHAAQNVVNEAGKLTGHTVSTAGAHVSMWLAIGLGSVGLLMFLWGFSCMWRGVICSKKCG